MQKPLVLIVGAGPTGLMMACQLTLFGIPFRIIEKNEHPTKESRALGIQARTLEIFRQIGIVERFLEQGQITKGLTYINGDIRRHIYPLEQLGQGLSEFPFLLMHEQSKTEKVFIDFLQKRNKEVEWSTELVRFTQDNNAVTAVLKNNTGKEETATFEYVFGADGARSVVRHGLRYSVGSYFIINCFLYLIVLFHQPFLKTKKFIYRFHIIPLRHFSLWHITCQTIGVVPDELTHKNQITFEDIKKHFSERLTIPVTISHPNWISIYHSHHRCVKEFRIGRCFLAGDAAHIHSPVGARRE